MQHHIAWTPRYSRKILVKDVKEYLEKLLRNLEGLQEDIQVKKVNVQDDYVNAVMVLPTRISVARSVQYVKT